MKTVKRVQQLYQERNKLLEESGLGDFAHTDEEIEQGCKESCVTEQVFQSSVWWAETKLKEKNT